jgi:hypothetical protein
MLGSWLIVAALASASGCFHLQAFQAADAACVEACHVLPQCARSHVYIFLVNGVDPINCANLTGMRDYLQSLGFIKTYYGQLYHTHYYTKEIRRLHCEDPDARFVLIGFSCGATTVRIIAQSVKHDGISIDLLVYVSGACLKNAPRDYPENVHRVINIQADSCIGYTPSLNGAENTRLCKVGHFAAPSHHFTQETLVRELTAIAGTVPVPPLQVVPPTEEEVPPTPRPLGKPAESRSDDWDFLKPSSHLGGRMPAAEK